MTRNGTSKRTNSHNDLRLDTFFHSVVFNITFAITEIKSAVSSFQTVNDNKAEY